MAFVSPLTYLGNLDLLLVRDMAHRRARRYGEVLQVRLLRGHLGSHELLRLRTFAIVQVRWLKVRLDLETQLYCVLVQLRGQL